MVYKSKRLPRKKKKSLKKAFGQKGFNVYKRESFKRTLTEEIYELSKSFSAPKANWVICSSEFANVFNEIENGN